MVFLHGSSHPRKLWPVARWLELGERTANLGFGIVLPWGSDEERERACTLAKALPGAVVPERLDLAQLAGVFGAARAAVGVDTGLTHLAAALGIPVVGIFGPTDPGATGVLAGRQAINVGGRGRFPSMQEVMDALVPMCRAA